MAIMENTFHCSNGHTFTANAKLRTRCPECGVSTKRSFDVKPIVEKVEAILEEKPRPVEVAKVTPGPVLIRQGRPRMAAKKEPVAKHANTGRPIGAKVLSAGLVKSHTIKRRGTMPTITKRPVKTAIARGIQSGHEQIKPYWHDVADKMGF
jgi:hypothetical protein